MTQTKTATRETATREAPDTGTPGSELLLEWLHGATAARLLETVTRMNLAEVIGDRVADLTELARHYGIPPDRLRRLMRALIDLGLCAEHRPDGYALTALGGLLHPDRPGSLHHLVRLYTDPITQRSWSNLEASLRTGRAGFVEAYGMPIFDYLADRPTLATTYHATMSLLTERIATVVAEHFDFGRFATVTDVGGGDGTLLREILGRHPGVRGVLVDNAEVVATAAAKFAAAGVGDRCAIAPGDFFEAVPAGSDLYLLKWILHDWDDDRRPRHHDPAALPGGHARPRSAHGHRACAAGDDGPGRAEGPGAERPAHAGHLRGPGAHPHRVPGAVPAGRAALRGRPPAAGRRPRPPHRGRGGLTSGRAQTPSAQTGSAQTGSAQTGSRDSTTSASWATVRHSCMGSRAA
jgi:hypothetical protein